MNGGKNKGYTIVEAIIFLAISGLMFVIAAIFVSGKQASVQFSQGVTEMASRLQSNIQEVGDGQFPDPGGTFTCVTPATNPIAFLATGSYTQGTHSGCVFLGKVIALNNVSATPQAYALYTVAGRQFTGSGAPVTQIVDTLSGNGAYPTAVTTPVNLTDNQTVPQSLQISNVEVEDGGTCHSRYGIGIFTNPAQDSSGSLINGAQAVSLYYVDVGGSPITASQIHDSNLKPAQKAVITITDGSRTAKIVLGAQNNQLTATLDKTGNATCP